ncbi:hypothetical protein J4443_02025 [Candidatus Woesearchaeota archaeon]|nr:hypothetical protein [Candidatus Woesearchaeota archaeon]
MWFAKAVKNLKWWDIALIKAGVFFFSLFVASYISNYILVGGRWLWLILAIALSIKPWSLALRHLK